MPASRSAPVRRVSLVGLAVLHGVLIASVLSVIDGLGGHHAWDWTEWLVRAVMYGIVMWAVVALQRPAQKWFGPGTPAAQRRRAADRAVARAVWDGVLPSDVDPGEWHDDVARWLRQGQAFRAFYVVTVLVVGGLVVLTAVRVDSGDRGVLALAAALAAAAPALLLTTRGPVRRARQLRDGQLPVGQC